MFQLTLEGISMVKKPITLFLVFFGIITILILSFNLYIEKEKQKKMDKELAYELTEEENVQTTVRNYLIALKRKDIEKYNEAVTKDLEINNRSYYFIKIMSNIIDSRFLGDNLSVIHLKKDDHSTTLQVKYELTFNKFFLPEGVYTKGKNKYKAYISLTKIENQWIITDIFNIRMNT
jgi:hypothetical protein